MKFHPKHLILIAILALAAWALFPPSDKPTEASPLKSQLDKKPVKYVLRMAPGVYLPGLQPASAPKPLEALTHVAREYEKFFPDTRIEFANVPSSMREWLVTQLSSAQAPDIFNVNVEDVWQDTQKGWYLPLDDFFDQPNPFVPDNKHWNDIFKYQAITQGKRAPDGHMYCLTYDMVETGIFYNKDLFKKLNLKVPSNFDEFIEIEKALKKSGHVPMTIDPEMLADWAVDLMFDQLYYPIAPLTDLNKDPKRAMYLANYLDWDEIIYLHRKGFFTAHDPRWVDLFRILHDWRQYMAQDIVNLNPNEPFFSQQAGMIWAASELVQRLARDPNLGFDWGVFYLPPLTKNQSRYASGRPMCVIGGSAMQYCVSNSAISDTHDVKTSERLRRVIGFLQFLTAPKNVDAVVNEPIFFLPNVIGVEPHAELKPFDEFLHRPYTSTKWYFTFDLKFDEIMRRMIPLYMDDGMTQDEFIDVMDRAITAAADNITARKKIDFSEFDRIWEQRADLRKKYEGLPDAAR